MSFDNYMDEEDQDNNNGDEPPCVVCQHSTIIASNKNTTTTPVCQSCCTSHSHSYGVWKDWIVREQTEYQQRQGCTHWNSRMWGGGVHVQRKNMANPELLLLKRVQACVGWAVHGLIFEFLDGSRTGYVVDLASIHNDELLARKRSTEWQNIEMGDFITSVSGNHLSRACFLCHTLRIDLASGRTITFASKHEPWKGESFEYHLPEDCLLHHVSFRKGRCVGVTAAETIMHLPVKSLLRVGRLEKVHQDTFLLLQLIAQRIDNTRIQQGEKGLGKDLWQTILCQFLVCRDLEPFLCSPIGKLQNLTSVPDEA